MKKMTTKIILMFAVITLLAITTTSCLVGFQSAQIKFKFKNPIGTSADYEYTITDDDDRFTIKEVKWKVPAGSTKTSDVATVTWFGYNQEIKDAKFKMKFDTTPIASAPSVITSNSSTANTILGKDIKAGQLTEIDLSKDLKGQ